MWINWNRSRNAWEFGSLSFYVICWPVTDPKQIISYLNHISLLFLDDDVISDPCHNDSSLHNFCQLKGSLEAPDNKVHGANMGPICGRQGPGGPHVGPMNFAIWAQWTISRNHTMSHQVDRFFDVERVQAISYEIMYIYIYVLRVKYKIWVNQAQIEMCYDIQQ